MILISVVQARMCKTRSMSHSRRQGYQKIEFEVTKRGRDASGKSFPTEWRHRSGAEVNVDWAHAKNGPDIPHVGFQTGGKRGDGGATRGHILLDDVPFNR